MPIVVGRGRGAVVRPACTVWWTVLIGTDSSPDVDERWGGSDLPDLLRDVVQRVENVLGQIDGDVLGERRVLRQRVRDELHALVVARHVDGFDSHGGSPFEGYRKQRARNRVRSDEGGSASGRA